MKASEFVWLVLAHTLPSKVYLSLRYKTIYGKWIDWNNPIAFTEKLQWLKIFAFRPEYVEMVDKVLAKGYIQKQLGDDYIIPLLKTWDSADDIDFNELPDKFVLKCNHDSGTVIVCDDKSSLDIDAVKLKLRKALKYNYYLAGRETPYKYVKRKVFAEQFLQNDGIGELLDYKFFCFNGIPKIIKIDFGRTTRHHANYYDMDMNLLPFGVIASHPDHSRTFSKPENYDKMVDIARQLSDNIPFVRVDLYNINGKIYFGELTFFPTSGFNPFTDPAWDKKLGDWLVLPERKQ